MKATGMVPTGTTVASAVLGVPAALLVLMTLGGRNIPFLSSDRVTLIVLLVLGMAMCARGIGSVAARGAWTHPLSILGYLVGVLILVIALSLLADRPFLSISTTRHAILAVALLSAAKLAFSSLHRSLSKGP
jgi:uncharacterized membrane protein